MLGDKAYSSAAIRSHLAYPDVTPDPSVGQAHLILRIQQGRHLILAPAPYAVSQFVRPA